MGAMKLGSTFFPRSYLKLLLSCVYEAGLAKGDQDTSGDVGGICLHQIEVVEKLSGL